MYTLLNPSQYIHARTSLNPSGGVRVTTTIRHTEDGWIRKDTIRRRRHTRARPTTTKSDDGVKTHAHARARTHTHTRTHTMTAAVNAGSRKEEQPGQHRVVTSTHDAEGCSSGDAPGAHRHERTRSDDTARGDVDVREESSEDEEGKSEEDGHASDRARTVFVGGTAHDASEERVREYFESEHGAVESVKLIVDRQTMIRKGYGFVKFVDVEVAEAVKALEKVTIDGKAVDVKEATRDEPHAAKRQAERRAGERERGGMSRGSSANGLNEMERMKGGVSGAAHQQKGGRVPRSSFGAKSAPRSPSYVGALDDLGGSGSESGGGSSSQNGNSNGIRAPGTESTVFTGGLPPGATPEMLGWFFAHYGTVLSVKLIYDRHTGAGKGYGFVVFADAAVAEMIKAQRQIPFMGKMIDVSEAMRALGKVDDGRGGYSRKPGGFGAQGPFYPPQMMYAPQHMMPPHMMGGQPQPMMMMPQMPYGGYPAMYPYDPTAAAMAAMAAQGNAAPPTTTTSDEARDDEETTPSDEEEADE